MMVSISVLTGNLLSIIERSGVFAVNDAFFDMRVCPNILNNSFNGRNNCVTVKKLNNGSFEIRAFTDDKK